MQAAAEMLLKRGIVTLLLFFSQCSLVHQGPARVPPGVSPETVGSDRVDPIVERT